MRIINQKLNISLTNNEKNFLKEKPEIAETIEQQIRDKLMPELNDDETATDSEK